MAADIFLCVVAGFIGNFQRHASKNSGRAPENEMRNYAGGWARFPNSGKKACYRDSGDLANDWTSRDPKTDLSG